MKPMHHYQGRGGQNLDDGRLAITSHDGIICAPVMMNNLLVALSDYRRRTREIGAVRRSRWVCHFDDIHIVELCTLGSIKQRVFQHCEIVS